MMLLTLVSSLSFFFVYNFWKYIEHEFGLFTSLFLLSFILFTLYGVYVYFKRSPFFEFDLRALASNHKNICELNDCSALGILERYNKEREKYLNDGLASFKKEGSYVSNDLDKYTGTQKERLLNEADNADTLTKGLKLSFFGLCMSSPNLNKCMYQHGSDIASSSIHEHCSPSILADTFINAATVARSCQSEECNGNLIYNQQQPSSCLAGSTSSTMNRKVENKNSFNSRLLGSVGVSFQSNIKSARSKFENYVSSLQHKITRRKMGSSIPGGTLSSTSISESVDLSAYGSYSASKHLIELLDDKSIRFRGNCSTPRRKTYKGFLSPLPTSKPSPILLLTGKSK
ncbi:putative signal peptide protein [Cryptosporidium canis]|uniref:Signal peptide protein n=1 Tax=Cryptosporidium canis TaxID=195482 RepID=A0A9D5HXS8_9CRYT|nr:putative signal peptide protein [Cryptosporidium canis]